MITEIFCCPICKTGLRGWPPSLKCSSCEHRKPKASVSEANIIQTDESILIFTDEPNLNLKGDKRYVGYDSQDWEIEEACLDPRRRIVGRSWLRGEWRYRLLGRATTSGKYLRVIYTLQTF